MSIPTEGLKAVLYLGTALGTANTIAYFQGVDLSATQATTEWVAMGNYIPSYVLRGVISFKGKYRMAFTTSKWAGTLGLGTVTLLGSLCPIGGNTPNIIGSVVLSGFTLSQMDAGNSKASAEEDSFIMYNLSFNG